MKTLKSMLIAAVLTSIAFTSTSTAAESMTLQGAFIYNETAGEYYLHQNNS